MGRFAGLAAAFALAMLISAPAHAGWKLIEHAQRVEVAKGHLTVEPGEDWNRNTSRPIKKGEIWTLDGASLNELYFVSGLQPGETLFKDRDKKKNPLPKMGENMLLTDIPEFYESSTRIALQTSLFEIESVVPANFAGHPGISFTFHYGIGDSPVIRKGIVTATLVNGELQLISFVAPTIHYYDRDLPKAETIIASAKL